MKARLLLPCAAALAFAFTLQAQTPDRRPDQRPDQPPRPDSPRPDSPRPQSNAPHDRGGHRPDARGHAHGDSQARLNHLKQAIGHLRAAGINEPAAHLEKMARELAEQSHRQQQGTDNRPPGPQRERSFTPPKESGRPPMAPEGMEKLQAELRSLAHQVQELRQMIQSRGGPPQAFARPGPFSGSREGNRRPGSADSRSRRPENPPQPDRRSQEGDRRREDGPVGPAKDRPSGEPRKEESRDDKPQDEGRRDGARDSRPRDGAPRDGAPRDAAPRDGVQRDGGTRPPIVTTPVDPAPIPG